MSLIAPLFLLGLAGIALPVWLHRLNTRSPERRRFSSSMLLEQSTQQTYIKKQLRYLLLLAFRVLFLAIMVFAFAKPLISKPPVSVGGEGSVLHMIVVDTSFSMKYGDRSDQARTRAGRVIAEMEDEDLGQIITASNGIEVVNGPTAIKPDLAAGLDAIEPGYGRLDFGAMITGLDRLVTEYGQAVRLHIISDFQETGLPAKFADLIPDSLKANLVGMDLYPVAGEAISNLYIASVERTDNGLRVMVRGETGSAVDSVMAIDINEDIHHEKTVSVSETGQATVQFAIDEYEPGENRVKASLLREDALSADNTRYAVIDNTPPKPVLLITADPESLPVRYLTAAVETGQQGFSAEPVAIGSLDPRVLQRYPWLIIDDLGIVNETLAPVIREYLQSGGAIFAALGDRSYSRDVIPVVDLPVRGTGLSSDMTVPHTVARIDSSHPAMAETRGWRDIIVTRFLNLGAGTAAEALVSLDDGSPLVLERKFGQGKIIVLTSSLDNKQNDIPIRPVFVNFIAEAGRYLSGEQRLKQHQTAGDFLQLLQSGTASGQVIDPEGRNLLSLAETHRSQDIKLNQTGFYEIYTSSMETVVAVNADLRESALLTMSNEALTAWRDAISAPLNSGTRTGPVNIEQESIELWHILLVLMGFIVLTESILGNRYLGSLRGNINGDNLSTT
jgi:hypothetical protein